MCTCWNYARDWLIDLKKIRIMNAIDVLLFIKIYIYFAYQISTVFYPYVSGHYLCYHCFFVFGNNYIQGVAKKK